MASCYVSYDGGYAGLHHQSLHSLTKSEIFLYYSPLKYLPTNTDTVLPLHVLNLPIKSKVITFKMVSEHLKKFRTGFTVRHNILRQRIMELISFVLTFLNSQFIFFTPIQFMNMINNSKLVSFILYPTSQKSEPSLNS